MTLKKKIKTLHCEQLPELKDTGCSKQKCVCWFTEMSKLLSTQILLKTLAVV